MMARPLISIIVATFNSAGHLPSCLSSIASQTFTDRELIIIDGCSMDGTVEIIRRNSALLSYWVSEPDRGIYSAWNKAIIHARGEWICFLGSDDRFFSNNVLERISVEVGVRRPEEILLYGQVALFNKHGKRLETIGKPWNEVRQRFLELHCVPHTGAFHHRSMFEAGGFDERFRIAGDYDLMLRELRSHEARFVPDLITVAMTVGGISSTPENSLTSLLETRRAQKKWGVAGRFPGQAWLLALLRALLRIALSRTFGLKRVTKLLDVGRRLMGKEPFWSNL